MPLATYLTLQMIVALTIPSILVVLAQLAPPGGPGPQDAWSVLGAMIASVIVMHREARGGAFSLWRSPTLSSFLASAFVGSIGPGLTINTILPLFFDSFITKAGTLITWHGWAGLGLLFGLSGSWLVKGWLAISKRAPAWMEDRAEKKLGIPKERDNRTPDWIDPPTDKKDDNS